MKYHIYKRTYTARAVVQESGVFDVRMTEVDPNVFLGAVDFCVDGFIKKAHFVITLRLTSLLYETVKKLSCHEGIAKRRTVGAEAKTLHKLSSVEPIIVHEHSVILQHGHEKT
jgi:hypothetical protein